MAKKKPSDDVMADALERFEDSEAGSSHNRTAYHEDFKFARLEEQWPDDMVRQRDLEGRPHLVINKLPALIRSVVNEARQNRPSIQVSPVDNGADEDTAEVIGGIVRSIERGSAAEVAYISALEQAVTGGMGFFRVGIDYAHDETFDMECTIDRIPNALQVHYDTSSTEFDASDWEYAFVSDMLSEREFEARYPDASKISFETGSNDSSIANWTNEDQIRVAEYFLKTEKKRQIIQFEVPNPNTGQMDLQVIREDDLPEIAKAFFDAGGIYVPEGEEDAMVREFIANSKMAERRRREVTYNEVMRRVINGNEVLSEEEWPGSKIPICPVWGDEVFLDGRRYFRSMIRSAKDSQMMFNFWRTATTELVALAPKAPWIGPKGFVPKGEESKWDTSNTRNHARLEYDPQAGPAPTRQPFAGVPAGALQEAMNSNDDMKAITGIFDSSIGAKSNETSGKAILARERQGDVSNYHFVDNLNRAIRYCGEILVEIIPSVYSARETVRILGVDQKQNVIKLTQQDGGAKQKGADGQQDLYNITIGKYDVTVDSGPSFATEREETRETLIEIMRQVPAAAPFIGDVLLDHMDFVGADKVAKRLKHLLPPEVKQAESDDVTGSDNPEAAALQQQLQAKEQEMAQAQKAVMAEIQKMQQENDALKADKSAEMQRMRDDAEIKNRELDIKEVEAQAKLRAPVVTPQEQWEYERVMEAEKRAFEAEERDKDRQVDLAKAILAKSATKGGDESDEMENESTENTMAQAMLEAAAIMASDRVLVRDEFGNITGSKVVTQ